MEISGASTAAASQGGTSIGIEVQKKTQEIQEQTAQALIEAVPQPDPDSSKGQNIDVKA